MADRLTRFALLRHEDPRGLHYDLLLESGGVLRTWALSALPEPGIEITAEQLPDHRLAYLDYEGEVSGGRGTVARCDAGTYAIEAEDAARLIVWIKGRRFSGWLSLQRLAEPPGHWRAVWSSSRPGE